MRSLELEVRTGTARGFTDLTPACVRFAAEASGGSDGLLSVFVPHATAGIVVLELGSGGEIDVMAALDRLLPRDDRYAHRHGSLGHGVLTTHHLPRLLEDRGSTFGDESVENLPDGRIGRQPAGGVRATTDCADNEVGQ